MLIRQTPTMMISKEKYEMGKLLSKLAQLKWNELVHQRKYTFSPLSL